jgi:hypothetical protein
MRLFYSVFKAFVVVPYAALGEGAVTALKRIVRSNNGRRLRQSHRDVRKTLYNDETPTDHRSTDFQGAVHVACSTPVFVVLLISNPLLLTWGNGVRADFIPIVREDGCATIDSASCRFNAAMFDGSKPLEGGHAYGHGAHL